MLTKALDLDKDIGDVWLYLIKLKAGQKDILDKFDEADPSHGVIWPKIFKRVENWQRPKREIALEYALNSLEFN